jgi:hypothetical protein
MSAVLPNTTVSILRGETIDAYGDPVDSNVSVNASVPISITHEDQKVYLPVEGRMTIIRQFIGRIRPGFDVREHDRLRDDRSGRVYLVEGISQPEYGTGTADLRIFLRRIDET